ncbi:iron chaperone [Zhihengliuella flava]|uniref:Uncharacterized protein YdhG (YjbR/CyaY superfamily) n=1 Tax=Zhihengliuella flava TaxID=1285193 RepID=A0A931GEY9_9MICC|nr:DUF1801 domain-containing protein [Zhihengliuella flava]MBG6084858.1 uncharacterized protein YdhG (YjbR/CyaY superfamily) [Zhihengliuella flava]
MANISSVDEFLSGFDGPARARLQELRDLSRRAAPKAAEDVRWNQPAYLHASGTILFMFSGHRAHANMAFTPSTLEEFRPEMGTRKVGKGTVQVPYAEPLPTELLTRMIQHRIAEHERDGIGWM